jgi:Delta7-sterol 5-desaturase
MFDLDLSNPVYFSLLVIFMFLVIVLRYFLIAGLFYFFFYIFKANRWEQRKVNQTRQDSKQFSKEVKWSLTTAFIFSIIGTVTALAWQKGYTAFYEEVHVYGLTYLFASLFILMIIHETYYYWVHRLMHHPKLYKKIHKVHHDSITTSPWTAFSFHPIEGLLEGIILPLMIFFIPVHYYTLLAYLMIMTVSSVINHLNIEIYPEGFEKHWLGKWLIGATHHGMHHSQFRYNYGLYFTFWDKWSKTESPRFKKIFQEKTSSVAIKRAKI